MPSYYYFAATLPTPQLGSAPPMTSAVYLDRCALHLRPDHLKLVTSALLNSPPTGQPPATRSSPLLCRYYTWERTVRNDLVRLRARRLEREAEPWLRPIRPDDGAPRVAAAVFAAPSPLEAEILLERERWALLRQMGALHVFDLERLAAYRLELQILERLALLETAKGEESYRRTYAAVLGGEEPPQTGVQT